MTKSYLIDFLEELAIELFYLAGESEPQASGTILGFAVTLDAATALLAKREFRPSVERAPNCPVRSL